MNDLKCPFIINQNRYSIFDRTIEENGLKETAHDLKKGIIAFSPLAQGMLTNRYLNSQDSGISDGRKQIWQVGDVGKKIITEQESFVLE